MHESSDGVTLMGDEAQGTGRLTPEELEIARIGEELFELWASSNLTAASMIGGISARIGAPLPGDSEEATLKAKSWATRLEAVNVTKLRRSTELTRRFLRFEVSKLAEAAALHKFDLQITPYRIGHTVAEVHSYMGSFAFATPADLDRYLALLEQYRVFLAGTTQNLHEQAAMGIVLPISALPSCAGLLKGLALSLAQNLRVADERLISIPLAQRDPFVVCVERVLEELQMAFGDLCAYVEGDYARHASQGVGLSQYSGGRAAYETLIRQHTTLELSAEHVHELGLDLVREIEEHMACLRSQLAFRGSGKDFLEQIKADSRFYCNTADDLGKLYSHLMRKGEAAMPKAFGSRTFVPFGLKRLPPESEAGMTFGYYQPPIVGGEQVGYYVYNGSALDQRPTIGAASLIYHELVPGHHLHFSTEMANSLRPLVRRFPTITAFTEGWAEYAADLGFELDLYSDLYDRYGRYLLQVFLASRLVVDTGLNAFGWTLQRARDYLLQHTAQSATEIESEILRYSSGVPGQALAYAPGRKHFWQIRHTAERRLGGRFDLAAFHDAILDGGSLPLADLSFSIEQWATQAAI